MGVPLLGDGELGPQYQSPSNTVCGLDEAYLHAMFHLDPFIHLAAIGMGQNWGLCAFSWIPIYHIVAGAEAYLRAKFHLDPSNRLSTIHQRRRQTERQTINGPIG